MTAEQKVLLPEKGIKEYMSLVMSIGWIVKILFLRFNIFHRILLTLCMFLPVCELHQIWDLMLNTVLLFSSIDEKDASVIASGSTVGPPSGEAI